MSQDLTSREDDALLRALAELEREERGAASLEAWAKGAISQTEAAQYSALASEPEAAELFAPWQADARDTLAEGLLAQLQSGVPAHARTAKHPRFGRKLGLAAASCSALLAAAALLLAVRSPPLPNYQIAVQAGDRSERSAASTLSASRRQLQAGSLLELRLWPTHALPGKVEAALWLREGEGFVALALPAELAASGALRWRGSARHFVGERRGAVDLIAVVARAGALPNASELRSVGLGQQRSWYASEIKLSVTPE